MNIRTVMALLLTAGSAPAFADPSVQEFSGWARTHLHPVDHVAPVGDYQDLEPLRAIIGDARIVSFGEGMHLADEPLQFRNRLFRFLVERMGFTAIALESGITEGFEVDRYVLGGNGDLSAVVARGFTFGFAALPQEADLVRWMHDYNAGPTHRRKIEFYGVDVPGSPEDMQSTLWVALSYLDSRNPRAAAALRARMADLVPRLVLDRRSDAPGQYTSLTQADRDRLTGTIEDTIAQFETHEPEYVAATSARAYAIAYRAAIAARQVDDYTREIPIGWKPKDGFAGLYGSVASAEHSKADNLQWVLDRMGPHAKLLVFMHRDHLAYTRSTITLPAPQNKLTLPPMVGMFMKHRYARDLVMIAHLTGSEAMSCGAPPTQARDGSLEAALASMPAPLFLLDLREAPSNIAAWLKTDREMFGIPPLNTTGLGSAYDALFFSRTVSRAIPCE